MRTKISVEEYLKKQDEIISGYRQRMAKEHLVGQEREAVFLEARRGLEKLGMSTGDAIRALIPEPRRGR